MEKCSDLEFSILKELPSAVILFNNAGELILLNKEAEKLCEDIGDSRDYNSWYRQWLKRDIDILRNSTLLTFKLLKDVEIHKDRRSFKLEGKKINIDSSRGYYFIISIMEISLLQLKSITDRLLYLDNLMESEDKYRSIFHNSPEYIYLIDPISFNIVDANESMLKRLHVSLEEIRKKKFLDFLVKGNESKKQHAYKKLSSGEEIRNYKLEIESKKGEKIFIESNCVPISKDGKVDKILCCARDITEKKKMHDMKKIMQDTIKKDKLKTEFFANISHELRTPLNVILGSLQLMDLYLNDFPRNCNYEKVHKYKKSMKQNCYRLMRLISNLIDITKIDAGYLNLNLKNCNIVNIIEEITLSVSGYVESKSLELLFDTNVEEKIMLCDPDKIERIMLNLLSNAIKFTKPGDSIKVNLIEKEDIIEVSVMDTGVGIPEDKLNNIFERFAQVNETFVKEYEGSGIGLSLVKSFVEIHGGQIYAKSTLGKGSEFIFTIPVRSATYEQVEFNLDNLSARNIERVNIEFSDIYF